jgi:serine/threonine-protein kinase
MSRPRYEIVDRIDVGGMAEVFRGKAVSLDGYEKQVAIKRVLPQLAADAKFVNMFLDEARVSLALSHANIVSVFDVSRAGETYFIVMEYVDGANLKTLMELARASQRPFPIAVAVRIGIEVCKALAYAHERKDSDGSLLRIVHRDVSPPNILISREGEVKITDFGLAKAASQMESTDPGFVKGKYGYLSPESADGQEVDGRSDIFSLGVILWELLAGRRLFQGDNDLETLQRVKQARIPGLAPLCADLHPELEAIVRRALAGDRDRRYATAREFGTDLNRFLLAAGLSVDSYDVAQYLDFALHPDTATMPVPAVMRIRPLPSMATGALELETAEPAVGPVQLLATAAQPAVASAQTAAQAEPATPPAEGQRRWVRPFLLLLLLAACMGAAYYYGLESASR